MKRVTVLALMLGCSPALAQVAPTPPAKPVVTKPAVAKPPVVAPPLKLAPANLVSLRVQLKDVDAEIDKLKNKKDSLSELGQQDMAMLQQMMEKKNQLESMISNVMRAGSEKGQSAIGALKGS